jgi:hypothetical protein
MDQSPLEFKPWDGEQEEQLAETFEKAEPRLEGGKVGKRASLYLQHLCSKIGGHELWKEDDQGDWRPTMPQAQREQVISNMWYTDVLTAFVKLRIDAGESPHVTFPISDPYDKTGKRTVDWRGNLANLPFEGSPSLEDQLWTFETGRPVKIRGKQVTKLIMGPMKWSASEQLEMLKMNPRRLTMNTLAYSIWEIPEVLPIGDSGSRLTYTSKDLRKVPKSVMNRLASELEANHHGLDTSIEVIDHEKDRSWESSVPWFRGDFFDVTSQ